MPKLQIIIHCLAISACMIARISGDNEPNPVDEGSSDSAAGGSTDHEQEADQVESNEEIVYGKDDLNATDEEKANSNNESDHNAGVISSNDPTSNDEISTSSIENEGEINNNPNLAAELITSSTENKYDEASVDSNNDDLNSTDVVTRPTSSKEDEEVEIDPNSNNEDVVSKNEMNYDEMMVASTVAGLIGSTDLNGTDLNVTHDVDTSSFLDCCGGKEYNPRSDICCHNKIYKLPEIYNFQSRWKCCGNIMYDSYITFCCDSNSDHILPKVDLAPDTGCCGPMNYNRTKDVCCIESRKTDFRYSYYVLHDVPDLSVFCCGDLTYSQGICCSGRLYRKEEYLQVCAEDDCICCGTSIASRSTQICCNYHLYPRFSPDDQCCGSIKFNSFDGTSMCCQGNLYQGYRPDSAACCGKQIYLVQEQDCCNEKLIEKNRTRNPNECCDTTNQRGPPRDMHVSKEPPQGSEISVQYFKIEDPENQDVGLRFYD